MLEEVDAYVHPMSLQCEPENGSSLNVLISKKFKKENQVCGSIIEQPWAPKGRTRFFF